MIEQQQQQIILEAGNQDQGVGRFGSLETSLLGLQMASFSLYAHVTVLQCVHIKISIYLYTHTHTDKHTLREIFLLLGHNLSELELYPYNLI